MIKRLLSTGAVLAMALAGANASASTFVALTGEQMITQADSVVQGSVVGIVPRWDDGGRLIVSDVRIAVSEVLVGAAPPLITVQTPGGEVGDIYVEAAGFPKFKRGEQVILFLGAPRGDGTRRVLGHQQGHYTIVTRNDGVTLAVPQLDEDVALLAPSGQRVSAPASIDVATFKAIIRNEAARLRAGNRQGRGVSP